VSGAYALIFSLLLKNWDCYAILMFSIGTGVENNNLYSFLNL